MTPRGSSPQISLLKATRACKKEGGPAQGSPERPPGIRVPRTLARSGRALVSLPPAQRFSPRSQTQPYGSHYTSPRRLVARLNFPATKAIYRRRKRRSQSGAPANVLRRATAQARRLSTGKVARVRRRLPASPLGDVSALRRRALPSP
ncbi:hypothetical protein H920_01268 [Fukomys damarensis]|uniref:Uncharacterized protein n=1 Tax=Fukomys damarensis TaxID=885580 RepID=A0A091ENS2_FUKDA|nr:hypothetical protein H920_01268 [Fukomys damarensis]